MIKFGTSGFRGIIGENFTKENVQRVAYALGSWLKEKKLTNNEVYIGFDNRFMGEFFAKYFSEVLVNFGVKIKFFAKSVPCTLIAYMAKELDMGIVITASHNPYYYNGIKVFLSGGKEPTEAFTNKVEGVANLVSLNDIKCSNFDESVKNGKIEIIDDISKYCENIVSLCDKTIFNTSKKKVLFNVMHGSTLNVLENILKELKLKKYKIINSNIDITFENKLPAPSQSNLFYQTQMLLKEKFDLGIAFDGDGDRVSFIDKNGKYYDCNYVFCLIYYYYINYKGIKKDVVVNTAFTRLLTKIANFYELKVYEVKVGFKNIAKVIEENNILLGAETNGICFSNNILHKDGILGALILIEALTKLNMTISEFLDKIMEELDYKCVTKEYAYEITDKEKSRINKLIFLDKKLPVINKKLESYSYFDGLKLNYDKGYWAVIRFSGNENVVRIFAEMENENASENTVKLLEKFIGIEKRQ